jgi:2-keto-4-pentenoate hydratase
MSDEELIDLLEKANETGDPAFDIAKANPALTLDDIYRLQLGYKKRQAANGDPIVGYRVSVSSRNGILESVKLGLAPPEAGDAPLRPMFTTLLQSNLGSDGCLVECEPQNYLYAEAEVAVIMGERLSGPNVTPEQARAAVKGLHAGFDMAQLVKESRFSYLHRVASACTRTDTRIILGPKMTPPTIDLRLEGILVSIDGVGRASATAWECLGDPMNAVAFLANKLGEYGEALEPGQIVVTGVCPYPQRIAPGERLATAEFTNLGRVNARVKV